MPGIAGAQAASTEALARQAHRILISDTDVLTTNCWHHELFGAPDPAIAACAGRQRWDLTLLLEAGAWSPDGIRALPDWAPRQAFAARLETELRPPGPRSGACWRSDRSLDKKQAGEPKLPRLRVQGPSTTGSG
jgi:nicotinamide riboside kinase